MRRRRKSDWEMLIALDQVTVDALLARAAAQEAATLRRCRSTVSLARALLPAACREDVLDEFLDDLACAAEAGEPVVRRTLSIVFRAIPKLAILHRLPSRTRRRG